MLEPSIGLVAGYDLYSPIWCLNRQLCAVDAVEICGFGSVCFELRLNFYVAVMFCFAGFL